MELFIDLIFVSFMLNLGDVVKFCGIDAIVLLRGMLAFLLVFHLRILLDGYSNLFYADDFLSRCLYLLFALGLAFIALTSGVPSSSLTSSVDGKDDTCVFALINNSFLVGSIVSRISILILYAIALKYDNNIRKQLSYTLPIIFFFTVISFFMFIPNIDRLIFFRIITITEIGISVVRPFLIPLINPYIFNLSADELNYYPINISTVQKRLQIFIMIAFGETIIQVLQPVIPDSLHDSAAQRSLPFCLMSVLLAFIYAMLYSDSCLRDDLDNHAMSRSLISVRNLYFLSLIFSSFKCNINHCILHTGHYLVLDPCSSRNCYTIFGQYPPYRFFILPSA